MVIYDDRFYHHEHNLYHDNDLARDLFLGIYSFAHGLDPDGSLFCDDRHDLCHHVMIS